MLIRCCVYFQYCFLRCCLLILSEKECCKLKKSLSIVLSLIMVFSCVSVLFTATGITASAAAGEMHTITTSVEKQNGLSGGVITTPATQSVAYDYSATVTAVPYYGNGFLGWYNGTEKVSSELSYTFVVKGDVTLTAKFDIRNLVENGNMEVVAGQQGLVDALNGNPSYSAGYKGTVSVGNTADIASNNADFGDYALKVTPAAGDNAGKRKSLLCIPVTVEKNTDYIWRFSYKAAPSGTYNNQNHALNFALNTALGNWGNAGSVVKFTYHSQPASGSVDTATWGWGGGTFTGIYECDNGRGAAGTWMDYYIMFNPGEDATIFASGNTGTLYLMLGCYTPANVDPFYIDNMSVSKAVANSMSTVTAEAGGSVTAQEYRQGEDYYVYTTYARGNANVYTGRDTTKVYYPSIYEKYTAKADAGSTFQGWYDGNTLVAKSLTYPLLMTGKEYTAKFASAVSASEGGTVTENADGTYTAKPFYGNTFVGWYDGIDASANLVTTDVTIDPNNSSASYAKFTVKNQIFDGDFETGAPNTDDYWKNLPHYAPKTTSPTYTVVDNPIKSSGAEFGDKVMMITPTQSSSNDKLKNLLNYPVEVEAGKQYIWRFAYSFLVPAYDSNVHYLNFSVDNWQDAGVPSWNSAISSGYSQHSQLYSYTKDNTNPLLQNVSDYQWSWGKFQPSAYGGNKLASGANEWVDCYIIFTAPQDGKYFLSLGTVQSIMTPLVFDNMSFTEVTNGTGLPTVTAGENGTVTALHSVKMAAFEALAARGTANPLTASIDATKPLYPAMNASYFAKADAGYLFDGWYDANGQKVSSDKELRVPTTEGGNYTAKFIYDPNRYYANAKVESDGGAYGGFLTGETEYNELTSGSAVAFNAIAYDGNTFKGWYDGSTLVSDSATLEYVVTKNTELVAKFERNNLMTDSGYENTAASTNVLGNGKEWSSADSEVYGSVVNIQAQSGINSVNFGSAAGKEIKHAAVTVEAGKVYHLAFDWMLSRTGTDYGLEYVKVYNAADNSLIVEDTNFTAATDGWQKFYANFNTDSATSIYFVFKYKGASSSIYVDDVVLFNTASAPFIIKTEMEMDDIYPGYLTCDTVQSVNLLQPATVSVKTYMANRFLGWYKDGEKVSDDETYTFAATDFAVLTAKFEVNNIIPDSGYENSQVGLSLSDAGLWGVNEANKALWGFDVWYGSTATGAYVGNKANSGGKFNIYAYDGDNLIRAEHRNNSITTTLTGLKMNTNYVFTYYWQIQNLGSEAYLAVTKLTGKQTSEELGAGRGVGIGATGTTDWQKVTIPFYSGQNTEVLLEIKYQAGSGGFYMDNMALYESDYITLIAGEGGSIDTTFNGGVSGPAQRGDEIVLNAVPDAGYEFVGWYDYTDSSKVFGTNTTYKFNANGAVAIAAYFKPIGSNEDPINYFVDGDFENNCLIPPSFDHPNSGTEWCNYGVTSAAGTLTPYSGDSFLRIEAHSRYTNFLISNLEPFTTYTVSMAYSAPEFVNFGSVMVNERRREWERREEKNSDGVYQVNKVRNFSIADRVSEQCLGFIGINSIDSEDGWETLEFTFTTNNRTEAYMQFSYGRPRGNNQLYIDDIKIKKTSSGYTDTIVDGDFETNSGIDGWQGNLATATDGNNTFGSVASGAAIRNNLNLTRFTDYTVTFKARSQDGATLDYGITRGGLNLFKANGTTNAFTNTTWGTAALTTEWKEYSFDITSNDTLQYTMHFISNGGNAQIDDVKIEKASSLKKANQITFEAVEGLSIRDYTYQTISTNLSEGSREWQATYALNKHFYELYTATAAGDAKVHSGNGSLVMKAENDAILNGLNATEKTAYETSRAPLAQPWARFHLQFGKTYEISYWVKAAEADTTFKVMMHEVDKSWVHKAIVEEEITVGTEWTKVTHKFVVGETIMTGNGIVSLCINRLEGGLKSDVYIDDIEVVQTASSVIDENPENLYTQDISQNYLENYSFEKTTGALGAYSKASKDAVIGDKIGTFNAGDKVIVPVKTRTDYKQTFSETYSLIASVRGNASAQGGIYLSVDPEGKNVLASFETDEIVKISPNTDGAWKRSGFTFADERFTTLYLVIECTAGTFDVDYLEIFNADYGYKNYQYDNPVVTFDPNDASNFVDAGAGNKTNYLAGEIFGLPAGSKVVLKGSKTYSATVGEDGTYRIDNIANGKYNMFIAASDAEMMTLWGDITFKDTVLSGLACERLNGSVTVVSGQGVRNGVAKIVDNDTGWAYLSATNANGEYIAYVLDCSWFVEGTTKDEAALNSYKVKLEQFSSGAAALEVAAVADVTTSEGIAVAPIVCAIIMVIAAAALVITRKKGARI